MIKGNCYEKSLELFAKMYDELDNLVLVHGYPRLTTDDDDKGKLFGHAWLEFKAVVPLYVGDEQRGSVDLEYCLDFQKPDHPCPKAIYYEVGQINPAFVTHYTLEQALEQLELKGHVGPWVDKVPEALFVEHRT